MYVKHLNSPKIKFFATFEVTIIKKVRGGKVKINKGLYSFILGNILYIYIYI